MGSLFGQPIIVFDQPVRLDLTGTLEPESVCVVAALKKRHAVTSEQVIAEAERNLEAKVPKALPAFHHLINRCLRFVKDPEPEDLQPYKDLADPKDLPILVTALREACPWLVTFNTRHYPPGHKSVSVVTPEDFVLRIRDLLTHL